MRQAPQTTRNLLAYGLFLMKLAASHGETWGFSPLTIGASVAARALIIRSSTWGYSKMSYRHGAIAAAALSLAMLLPAGFAGAADLPVKAKAKLIADRVTYSYIFTAAQPGMFSIRPDGTINAKTAKSVYSFTHFDAWAYGTNFFTISMFKSDHNDPVGPCTNPRGLFTGRTTVGANCAGATEFYCLIRST